MDHCKLRLKDPSGAEFEAEGTTEFVLAEKTSFLAGLTRGKAVPERRLTARAGATTPETAFWSRIITDKGDLLKLRFKSPEIIAVEAVLILMAANRTINQKEDLGAITLSKALKSSGYEPDRLDRLLSKEIRDGRVTASGTKRNRTYQITQKGLEKAYMATRKLNKDTGQQPAD